MINVIKALLTTASIMFIFLLGVTFALKHPRVSAELMDIIGITYKTNNAHK